MNRHLIALVTAGALVLSGLNAFAGSNSIAALKKASKDIPKEKDQLNVQSALLEFENVRQMGAYFDNCYAVAIFPTIGKGGMGIGGAHGTGWVFAKGDYTGEAKMTQVSIGWQLGGQAFSQIIFFEDERAYRTFISGEFEFGAQASAVALTAGANASASTAGGSNAGAGSNQAKEDYTGGMAIFTVAKGGLMYEASLGGQKFSFKAVK
ncbi:MAG: lipid-binding SYLF domain-containing protein [Opitutaceae bacterium]